MSESSPTQEPILSPDHASIRSAALHMLAGMGPIHGTVKKRQEDLGAPLSLLEEVLQETWRKWINKSRIEAIRTEISEEECGLVAAEARKCLGIDQSVADRVFLSTVVDAEVLMLGLLCFGIPWLSESLGFLSPDPVPGSFAANWQKRHSADAPYPAVLAYLQRVNEMGSRRTPSTADGRNLSLPS